MQKLQDLLKAVHGWRRRLATMAVLLLAGMLGFHVLFGANGWVVFRQKVREHESLQKEVRQVQLENERLETQIKNLKTDPNTIEKEAREQLKYARPGEVVYVMPERKEKPVTATAEKH
ncbi:MAG TPA: septum formation initiator family protein [Clostridia bacterium]|nr:septum formation initiator family protein [Clostridia bacterium]